MKRLSFVRRGRSWHLGVGKRLAALLILLSGGCAPSHRPAQPPPAADEHEWQTLDREIGRLTDPWKAENEQ